MEVESLSKHKPVVIALELKWKRKARSSLTRIWVRFKHADNDRVLMQYYFEWKEQHSTRYTIFRAHFCVWNFNTEFQCQCLYVEQREQKGCFFRLRIILFILISRQLCGRLICLMLRLMRFVYVDLLKGGIRKTFCWRNFDFHCFLLLLKGFARIMLSRKFDFSAHQSKSSIVCRSGVFSCL